MVFIHSIDHDRQEFSSFVDESLSISEIDLTNCDREPIHIPNAIQPHGVLVIFHRQTLELLQVSANIEDWTQRSPTSLKGATLKDLFLPEQVNAITDLLSATEPQLAQPIRVNVVRSDETLLTGQGLLHLGEPFAALEIEPLVGQGIRDYMHFAEVTKSPIQRLQRTKTLAELCNTVVHDIQAITGFDRVMVYRFHSDGSGSVIAEAAQDGATPYLGLRYPATDIPRQAKQLYTLTGLRIIPDVAYQPVPMCPCMDVSDATQPLDMSRIGLRSVSPMHVEYLSNMGVKASLSISLLQEGQLWGLIACHHSDAKMVDMPTRTCCEFIGQIMPSELGSKERHEILIQRKSQQSVLTQLEQSILASPNLQDAFESAESALLSLVNATGVAYFEQDQLRLWGQTPDEVQVQQILKQLKPLFEERAVYETQSLSQVMPEAQSYPALASGVLGLAISKTQNIFLLWFRPELPQWVQWAGNPHKPMSLDEDGQPYLTPRQSFERWVEMVSLNSEAWSPAEVEMALELRSSIIGLVLQKADELTQVNLELARSNEDLASFAYVASHDLKAPLRAIANLACWIQEDLEGQEVSKDIQMQLDLLQSRVYRMHDMIQGLLQYSRVGDHAQAIGIVSIPDLLKEILDSLSPPQTFQIDLPQGILLYETNSILLKQVLTNLLSNAIKYIDRPDGHISVEVKEGDAGLWFAVTDNGPGIAPKYHDKIFQMFQTLQSRDEIESTGIGLAIVKKVVVTQGGALKLRSQVGEGSEFIFTWPQANPITVI